MMKRLLKNAIKSLFRRYYSLRNRRVIWSYLLNYRPRKLHRKYTQKATVREREVIAALLRDGIAFANIADFFSLDVLQNMQDYVERRWSDPDVRKEFNERGKRLKIRKDGTKYIEEKNYFLIQLWEGEHVFDPQNIFLQLSLSRPILSIASGYLEMFPKFRYWELQATVPNIAGDEGNVRASQRWHRDPDDRKMVKMFLYLNDVDTESGPFFYVKGSHSLGVHRQLFPSRPPPRIEDDMLPHDDIVRAVGKAGTLIFADTTGLHKGGFAKSKNRFMYTSAYMSQASLWPTGYTYPKDFIPSTIEDPMAQFAIMNDMNQKELRWYQ